MQFGIFSAPKVFQQKRHEFIEGLCGLEVVADKFIATGQGTILEEASKDHDKNLGALLLCCRE